jgi:hypothetical protein
LLLQQKQKQQQQQQNLTRNKSPSTFVDFLIVISSTLLPQETNRNCLFEIVQKQNETKRERKKEREREEEV